MPLIDVEEAVEDIRQGKFLIIVDDESRENEGDLAIAAEKVTPEAINFMITHARGILCMPMIGERLDELDIPLMVRGQNTSKLGTAFTIPVDHKKGTTGVSAYDRAATVKAMIDPDAKPSDFTKPGHLFPLRYQEGGVLVRAGHTEAIVDLARMAGLYPAGVVCEMVKDDGTMARLPDLEEISRQDGINIVSIAQIINHRRRYEKHIQRLAESRLPTQYGEFTAVAYKSTGDPGEHLALTMGDWGPEEPILVRVHDECLTGEVFKSLRCDCGEQIEMALKAIASEGRGVFLYMRQEGRGIGLHNKIRAYSLQDQGLDTVEANMRLGFAPDLRHYGIGAQILLDLGVRKMRMLTNNPKKVAGVRGWDLEVVEMVPIQAHQNPENKNYLNTKKTRMGHLLDVVKEQPSDS